MQAGGHFQRARGPIMPYKTPTSLKGKSLHEPQPHYSILPQNHTFFVQFSHIKRYYVIVYAQKEHIKYIFLA
ncbi:MAG: hypothetical protein D8H98_07960 [Prevotella sp.]|nr:MAG: hypothetical protein D8H98_07960 [Prevotella sp.]